MVAAGLSAAALPASAASSAPATHPFCTKNIRLPYDHPLGLQMRVLDGPDFKLADYRGKVVLLNIFATWCPPCNEEMPALIGTASRYADQGLAVIGVNFRESDNTVRAFRKKYAIPYPIAMDEHGAFTHVLEGNDDGKLYFPTSLFIDRKGRMSCYRVDSTGSRGFSYEVEQLLSDS